MGTVIPEQLVLWRAVQELGIQVTIVGTDANIYRGRWPWHPRKPHGIESVLLQPLSPAVAKGHLWWTYRGLSRTLARIRPDLVHVVSEPWGALVVQTIAVRWMGRKRTPVCVHGADNIFDHGNQVERVIRRAILSQVWSRIDGFASWSSGGIEAARRAGLPNLPTTVVPGIIPDPVSFSSFLDRSEARSKFGLPPGELVVGYVGRLEAEKGIEDLLQAIRSLGPAAPFISVWGAGSLEGLVRHSMSAGEIRGSFGGALDFSDVSEALHACDIIVIPSKTTPSWMEQFGRIIVEAMMAGSAVVAYRSGSIPEVAGQGAILLDEGDVGSLADSIRHLAADDAYRAELAARGTAEALSRFAPPVMAEQLERFWAEVLAE